MEVNCMPWVALKIAENIDSTHACGKTFAVTASRDVSMPPLSEAKSFFPDSSRLSIFFPSSRNKLPRLDSPVLFLSIQQLQTLIRASPVDGSQAARTRKVESLTRTHLSHTTQQEVGRTKAKLFIQQPKKFFFSVFSLHKNSFFGCLATCGCGSNRKSQKKSEKLWRKVKEKNWKSVEWKGRKKVSQSKQFIDLWKFKDRAEKFRGSEFTERRTRKADKIVGELCDERFCVCCVVFFVDFSLSFTPKPPKKIENSLLWPLWCHFLCHFCFCLFT